MFRNFQVTCTCQITLCKIHLIFFRIILPGKILDWTHPISIHHRYASIPLTIVFNPSFIFMDVTSRLTYSGVLFVYLTTRATHEWFIWFLYQCKNKNQSTTGYYLAVSKLIFSTKGSNIVKLSKIVNTFRSISI